MSTTRLLRLAGVGLAALALGISALALRQAPPAADPPLAPGPPSPPPDPLAAALRHCQALGEAGARDADCLATWAEGRRRFLGLSARTSKE
ncbi:putative entry exclusion protein TrbK-alt [Phenylobacterium sp.]|uniref:putative entry exclusion protein TrbK-alt n=1 Tax=Phenylobacterium sp. TaxID=1871053 RepID=UPI0035B42C23